MIDTNSDYYKTGLESILVGATLTTITYVLAFGFGILEQVPSSFELIGVLFNYACVYAAAREWIISWVWGIVAVLALSVFFWNISLYSSLALHFIYFLPIQFIGMYNWFYGGKENDSLPVTNMTIFDLLMYGGVALFAFVMIGTVNTYFDGKSPFLDTAILTASVVAQQLMVSKKIESWIVWMMVNVVAIYVYASAEAYMLSIQYVIFLGNAFYGYYNWRKSYAINGIVQTNYS